MFYSKAMSTVVRDELLAEGKDGSMGAVVSVVASRVRIFPFSFTSKAFVNDEWSMQWKSLTDIEREPYHRLAKEDKARYDRENRVRSRIFV